MGPRRGTGARLHSHRGAAAVPFEHQQALVLGELRRAAGRPVSFDELRRTGVEFPAGVVSELELAGVGLERSYTGVGGDRRLVGVRLDPERDPLRAPDERPAERAEPRPREASGSWSPLHIYRASLVPSLVEALVGLPSRIGSNVRRGGGRSSAGGPLALLALLVVTAVLATLLAVALAPGAGRGRPTFASRSGRPLMRPSKPTARRIPSGLRASAGSAPHPAAVPVSPGLAIELQAQGHDLLLAGRSGDAVPVLERALAATGERPGSCLAPSTDVCLTYAYALYDLGRALRLSGQPSAAVPVLERRFAIDNQRPAVAAELALARQQGG